MKHWAKGRTDAERRADAQRKIKLGFKNFLWSDRDYVVHHSIREYLCPGGRTYHLTDLSKGAMDTDTAEVDRTPRYENWYPLLHRELALLMKPETTIIAVGHRVANFLASKGYQFKYITHYSAEARGAHKKYWNDHPAEHEAFARFWTYRDVLGLTGTVLEEPGVQESLRKEIPGGDGKGTPGESLSWLAFEYWHRFTASGQNR